MIDRGKVIEARPCSDEQVEAERRRDHAAKERIYGQTPTAGPAIQPCSPKPNSKPLAQCQSPITGKS